MRKLATAFLLLAGCAVDLGSGMSIDDFTRTPSAINVTGTTDEVTCNITVTSTGNPILDAGCVFVSPNGRRASCIAHDHVSDVWTCVVPFKADTDAGTWAVDYVFARDSAFTQAKATNAQLVAGSLPGVPNAAALDVAVTSTNADSTPPTINTFSVTQSPNPGDAVTCTVGATDTGSGIRNVGCTFTSSDGRRSCTSHNGGSCSFDLSPTADAGVTWTEKHHFARDKVGNVTKEDDAVGFTVVAACVPATDCNGGVWVCGSPPDGCGGVQDCGTCTPPLTCDGSYACTGAGPISANFEMNDDGGTPDTYNCTSPCFVNFDAVERPSDPEYPLSSSGSYDPFTQLYFDWDFGDPTSGTWSTTGNSKNTFSGPLAAHVFETTEGGGLVNFTVTMTATDPDGNTAQKQKTIAVQDAATTYASTTVCISRTNPETDWTGCPSGATQLDNQTGFWDDIIIARWGAGDKRVLFKRGQAWDANSTVNFETTGPGHVGAWGSGNRPDVTWNVSSNQALIDAGSSQTWWVFSDHVVGAEDSPGCDCLGSCVPGHPQDCPKFMGSNNSTTGPGEMLVLRVEARPQSIEGFTSFAINSLGPTHKITRDLGFVETKFLEEGIGGGSCNFVGVRRFTVMGSEWQRCFGEHILRFQFGDTALIANNRLEDPRASPNKVLIGMRDVNCNDQPSFPNCAEDSGNYVISDNLMSGSANGPGNQAAGSDGGPFKGRYVVAERNFCFVTDWCANNLDKCYRGFKCIDFSKASQGGSVSEYARIANNVAYVTDPGWEALRAFTVNGDNVIVENNTVFYAEEVGGTPRLLDYQGGTNVTFRNNLMFDAVGTGVLKTGSPPTDQNNLRVTSNPFIAPTPTFDPLDYRIATGQSTILDSGATTGTRVRDFQRLTAPQDCASPVGAAHNIGAHEECP